MKDSQKPNDNKRKNIKRKRLLFGITLILVILIVWFIILIFLPRVPKAEFVDIDNQGYIKGYVYFDAGLLGETDGMKFNGFPREYCRGTHVIRLESGNDAYEWQTYPVDCRTRKVSFNIEHEKAQPSRNVVFRFLDHTGAYYMEGKLYFDGRLIEDTKGEAAVARDECRRISAVRLEHGGLYTEWDMKPGLCDINSEFNFKVS